MNVATTKRKRWVPKRLKSNEKISFIAHLEELRYRLIVCLIAVGAATIAAFLVKEHIFAFLAAPLLKALPPENRHLVFTGLYEAFMVYLRASFLAGILAASPVVFYHLWAFISPGLYPPERHTIIPFMLCSTLFFVGGGIFGYYMVFPHAFHFLLGYAGEFIKPLPSMKEYLNFAMRLLLAFGLVFELPIFIFFLSRVGIVDARTLKKGRKFAIPVIFTVAAVLTPGPDVFTQLMMALPLLVLYEVGILVAKFFGRKPLGEKDGLGNTTGPLGSAAA